MINEVNYLVLLQLINRSLKVLLDNNYLKEGHASILWMEECLNKESFSDNCKRQPSIFDRILNLAHSEIERSLWAHMVDSIVWCNRSP